MVVVNECIYGDKFSDKEKEKMVVKCNKANGIKVRRWHKRLTK